MGLRKIKEKLNKYIFLQRIVLFLQKLHIITASYEIYQVLINKSYIM